MTATLRGGALSLLESTIMGLAGSAPAFSIASVLAVLLATAGSGSIVSLFVFAVPMLGIACAYKGLNRRQPCAGAVYEWTTGSFGRLLGFVAGWAVLISSLVSMVSDALILGANVFDVAIPGAGEPSKIATLAIGAAAYLAIAAVLIVGIGPTSKVQLVLTGIELVILSAITIAAAVRVLHAGAVQAPDILTWSGPIATPGGFASIAVVVVFFYWGWDVTGNLAEETAGHPVNAAGQGGFLAVFLTIAIFFVFTLAARLLLTPAEVQSYGVNIVYGIARAAGLGAFGAKVAAFAVVLSTIATVETTMLQCSRGLFAMSRDRAMPTSLGVIHPATRTPVRAMLVLTGLSVLLLVGACFLPTAKAIITDSVNAVAVQVCAYYGLAGLVCATVYRRSWRKSKSDWLLYCAFPFASAVALIVLGIYAITSFDRLTAIVGVGGLLVGFVFFRPRGWGGAPQAT